MTECRHSQIVLLQPAKNRMRCRHCHLTIAADELEGGYCPECNEMQGKKRYDFEEVATADSDKTRYRCEDCGVIIEASSQTPRSSP
ncbi:MAG: hypothetical protein GY866_09455 [Proteobacteria bacterium]|nr:hypothetical protein [Pseudomonadota bacterium]